VKLPFAKVILLSKNFITFIKLVYDTIKLC